MGYLIQEVSAIAHTEKLSFSAWFNVPGGLTSTDAAVLLSMGTFAHDLYPDYYNEPSYIAVYGANEAFSRPPTLEVRIRCPFQSISGHSGSTDPGRSDYFNGYVPEGGTTVWTDTGGGFVVDFFGNFSLIFDVPFLDFAADTWYHVLIALDVSSGADLVETMVGISGSSDEPLRYRFRASVMINGTSRSFPMQDYRGDTGPVAHPTDPHLIGAGFPNAFSVGDGTVPVWPISIFGEQVSVPGLFFNGPDVFLQNVTPNVKMSDVQMWTGQYIDPVANIGKFVTIAGGHGTPVLPSVAAAAFGRQTYLFKGNKAAFPLNLGNGGDFTKIGTINNATPGPSF